MAGTNALDLQAFLEDLLAASIDALDTIPTFDPGLGGAPDRTYVNAGQPAFDCCDQLTVNAWIIRIAPTEVGLDTGVMHKLGYRLNHVGAQISITRCLEGWEPNIVPTAGNLQALAEQTNADAWALWNYLWNLAADKTPPADSPFSICREVFFDALTPVQPSGGCAGYVLNMRTEIEGYE